MFSVDNFYDHIFSNYGLEKTKNLVMVFQPHGSKDLHNLEIWGVNPLTILDFKTKKARYGRLVMHDQEPFFLDYVDTYRKNLIDQKKQFFFSNEHQVESFNILSEYAPKRESGEFFRRALLGDLPPIICHSEANSDDIKILEEHGFISCYYWWHGMIARDWFRHWQYYDCLEPQDKSNNKKRFLLYARAFDGTRSYRRKLVDHCQKYKSMIEYQWEGDPVSSDFSAKIDISDAVFPLHIIAETLFAGNKIYLTEKVFKPMVMSQAFILFGPPGSLRYLRDYGFQTFDQCWDESYDLEIDPEKRMEQLLNLIDHLMELPVDKFQEIYQLASPVIEHNRKRFFSTEFQDDLIREMRQNISQALLEQNQGHKHGLDDKSYPDGQDV